MTASRARRTRVWLALASICMLALSGCKFQGAASIPLPGGAGGNGYQVQVEFTDVLDLVRQSAVKVNDVTVGTVQKIELSKSGYTAVVTVSIDRKVVLPANATAAIRQTSLLGEKFVSLDRPPASSSTPLRGGDYIGLKSTQRNADVEEVLGALSLVLNGGSLEQLKIINSELTKALKNRETDVRDFLVQLTGFVGGLDDQKSQIVHALDGLDRLSAKLAAGRQTLDVALRDIPQGTAVLADERAQLTRVLTGLSNLGTVATRVISATQQNTIADLRALQPILGELAAAGKDLPEALELLTTYPFPRTVSLPGGKGGIRGDYANLFVTIEDDPLTLLNNVRGALPVPLPSAPAAAPGVAVPAPQASSRAPQTGLVGTVGLAEVLGADAGDLARLLFGGLS